VSTRSEIAAHVARREALDGDSPFHADSQRGSRIGASPDTWPPEISA
jgi:hypothetical protein